MEPHQRMNEKIELLLEELRRINSSITEAGKSIKNLDRSSHNKETILELKEKFSTIQARVEGLEVFVDECRKIATEKEDEHPEDIDIWM